MFQYNQVISKFSELVNFVQLASIGQNCFLSCSLVEFELPLSVRSLGTDAFRNCSQLKTAILNEGLLTMSRSFYLCGRLLNITIPSTVTGLGNEAFYNCPALIYIKALPTTPPSVSGSWLRYNSTVKIYVPDNSLTAYKEASGWSTYASRILPLSEFED